MPIISGVTSLLCAVLQILVITIGKASEKVELGLGISAAISYLVTALSIIVPLKQSLDKIRIQVKTAQEKYKTENVLLKSSLDKIRIQVNGLEEKYEGEIVHLKAVLGQNNIDPQKFNYVINADFHEPDREKMLRRVAQVWGRARDEVDALLLTDDVKKKFKEAIKKVLRKKCQDAYSYDQNMLFALERLFNGEDVDVVIREMKDNKADQKAKQIDQEQRN